MKSSKIVTQRDRFTEVARQLGTDEDEAVFKTKLAQIARQKVKGDVPEPPKAKENSSKAG